MGRPHFLVMLLANYHRQVNLPSSSEDENVYSIVCSDIQHSRGPSTPTSLSQQQRRICWNIHSISRCQIIDSFTPDHLTDAQLSIISSKSAWRVASAVSWDLWTLLCCLKQKIASMSKYIAMYLYTSPNHLIQILSSALEGMKPMLNRIMLHFSHYR